MRPPERAHGNNELILLILPHPAIKSMNCLMMIIIELGKERKTQIEKYIHFRNV